jgi:hypothetical protein
VGREREGKDVHKGRRGEEGRYMYCMAMVRSWGGIEEMIIKSVGTEDSEGRYR